MFRACNFMCPFWIPSEASALIALKFCARPTATITHASSLADLICRIFAQTLAIGWTLIIPPTTPTDIGSSILPTKLPALSLLHCVSDRYLPDFAAYAWAAASIARVSWPVAFAAAIIPFIIPLLCVTALYSSLSANWYAKTILSTVCSPPSSSLSNVAVPLTSRLVE